VTTQQEPEARFDPGVERVYRNDTVEVTWAPSYCTHFRACVSGAPRVFDPQRRPWVDVDRDAAETIVQVVSGCPTGALHARLLDAQPEEERFEATGVYVQQDGPLFVRGRIQVIGADGKMMREDVRLALCRCGASQNKPFCDDSHYRIGFKG
jgi:uncharacterized Fe-S cluster protein YjdI